MAAVRIIKPGRLWVGHPWFRLVPVFKGLAVSLFCPCGESWCRYCCVPSLSNVLPVSDFKQNVPNDLAHNKLSGQSDVTRCPPLLCYAEMYTFLYSRLYFAVVIYRVSQEECAKLREGVPYVKVYRYNPKHLCPKLNGYGDNGERSLKLWQLLHTYWLPNTY